MKFAVFIVWLVSIVPLTAWLRRGSQQMSIALVLLGFAPFGLIAVPAFDVALIDWAGWPGYVKGLLFSVVDVLALSIILASNAKENKAPFKTCFLIYVFAVFVALFNATLAFPALFYVWQLFRVLLIFWATFLAVKSYDDARLVVIGLGIGLVYQLGLVVYQRFGLGMFDAAGGFGHRNALGLVSNMIMLPLFGLFIIGRSRLGGIGALSGIVIAALSASRATLGLAAIGCSGIFLLSLLSGRAVRGGKIALLVLVVLVPMAPLTIAAMNYRFEALETDSGGYDERAAFRKAAFLMNEDHPFGVGSNNFVTVANGGGYYERAGVAWGGRGRSSFVHNIYILTIAETGYLGLMALLLMLLRPLQVAVQIGWRNRKDQAGMLLLSISVGLIASYIHSYFEWILFFYQSQAILAMMFGIIASLSLQLEKQ